MQVGGEASQRTQARECGPWPGGGPSVRASAERGGRRSGGLGQLPFRPPRSPCRLALFEEDLHPRAERRRDAYHRLQFEVPCLAGFDPRDDGLLYAEESSERPLREATLLAERDEALLDGHFLDERFYALFQPRTRPVLLVHPLAKLGLAAILLHRHEIVPPSECRPRRRAGNLASASARPLGSCPSS